MTQHNNNLSLHQQGKDVALLQSRLMTMGHTIATSEVLGELFGESTQQAVIQFQQAEGLPITGRVDDATAQAIVISFEADKTVIKHTPLPLHPLATQSKPVVGGDPLPDSPVDEGGGGIDVQPPPTTGVPVHTSQGDGHQLDPTLTIREEIGGNATMQQRLAQVFIVKGQVQLVNGKPEVGVLVQAYDRDLRSEQLLGEQRTDSAGHYEISYTAGQFARAEKGSADLRVSASNADGRELVSSPISFNAGPAATIDLVIGGAAVLGPSEYELLLAAITPVLQGLSPAQLTEDDKNQDVSFLVSETGEDPEHLIFLIQAYRLSATTAIAPDIYYGLFRQRMPTDLLTLLSRGSAVLRQALELSLAQNIIPPRSEREVDAIIASLSQLAIRLAAQPPAGEQNGHAVTLGSLAGTVLNDQQAQSTFVERYVNQKGTIDEFWENLEAEPGFKGRVPELQLAMQLGALTSNHLPLVQALQKMQQSGQIAQFSDLARFDEAGWLKLVQQPGIGAPSTIAGKDDNERAQIYARGLANLVEDAVPMAFITQRLHSDEKLAGREDLLTFFQKNADFDLTSIRLEGYLAKHPEALQELKDPAGFKAALTGLQRIYHIAPRYTQASVLLNAELNSSYRITRMGPTLFVLKHGAALGGEAQTRQIYERAERTSAMALNLLGKFGLNSSKFSGQSSLPIMHETAVEQVEGIPDWATLFFGSLDLCACKDCRSVYSPAAYLVDALHFLKDRGLVDPQSIVRDANGLITSVNFQHKTQSDGQIVELNVKDVLFERRPDLGEIELTCENTNTPLPYVDLVNEILENAIAPLPPFTPFSLASALVSDLDSSTLSQQLKNAFTPPLSPSASITVKQAGSWWTIDELAFTYTIRNESGTCNVSTRSLQTSGSPQERAANPQYMNSAAYDLLPQQVYPWSLPFDLWLETVRAYLGQLGVQRAMVMETFLPGDRPTVLADVDLAREYLGLSTTEALLITGVTTSQSGAATPGPWNLWGFVQPTLDATHSIPDPANSIVPISSGNWLDVLSGRVDVFLQQSGLSFVELLNLLGTYAINPLSNGTRPISIQTQDGQQQDQDTCDPKLLKLVGFDPSMLAKIVRFVRLWRTLGWTMRELDQALAALQPADLNDAFFVQLSHIKRLQSALNLPVESLLSFWAALDSAAYLDYSSTELAPLPSLYTRLFRTRTVVNQPDPAFSEDPSQLSGNLSEQSTAIMAALSISADDFALLLNDSNIIPQVPDPMHSGATMPDDTLSLDSLSRLYRHATLAKALQLSITDYLSALKLVSSTPFASTATVVLFVERVQKLQNSPFSLLELNYLLRHDYSDASGVAPTDDGIALLLEAMRAGLQKIAAENTFSADPANPAGATIDTNGDLTRKKLALLNWESALIAQVITTLNNTRTYSVTLSALDPGIVIPAALQNTLTYDSDTHILSFARAMTEDEQHQLLSHNVNPNDNGPFMAAIIALFDAPRTFIARNMHSFSVPDYQAPLAGLPASVTIPSALWRKVYYNSTTAVLHAQGALTESERDTLLALSTNAADPNNAAYRAAINALYAAPDSLTPTDTDTFLLPADSSAFFDSASDGSGAPITSERRFSLVLQKLLPYLRTTLSHNLVIQQLGEALQVENKLAQALLAQWINVPTVAGQKAIEIFLVDAFAQSNPKNTITRAAFGDQFTTYTLLYKVALLITRLKITALQLNWLFAYRQQPGDPTAAWLDLNALPLRKLDDGSGLFTSWTRLLDLCTLRASLPGGETTLNVVFAQVRAPGATLDALLAYLNTQARWALPELTFLTGTQGFHDAFPAAFEDEIALTRLAACLALLTRLGMSSALCHSLSDAATMANPTQAKGVALAVKQAVKAQYDEEQWVNTIAQPLCDILREKQRAALVAYLVTHPDQIHGQYWRTSNDLYAHFLIDVEMSPCQMTSRIKQALSSIQLFVLRCLMNLEPEVMASTEVDIHWQQWTWMKSYRIWEANREIFLYPENWIEPELRDDKSPFFKELESELQQNSLTKDTAEAAFQHYLEKLDAVAHLEIVSLYHQQEYDAVGNLVVDILHTVGRTRGATPVYYYRQRKNTNGAYSWTAWQKITADIQGDHIFPLIWNRRLHLFWAVLSTLQPPQPIRMPQPNNTIPESTSFWKIQLAWSEFQNDKWTSKTLSKDYLRCWKSGGDGDNVGDFDENDNVPQHHGQSLFTFKAAIDPNSDSLDILCVYDRLNAGIIGTPCEHERLGNGIFGLFHFAGCSSLPVAVDLSNLLQGAQSNLLTPKRTRVQYMTFSEFDPSDKSPWCFAEKFDPADDSLYLVTSDFPLGATHDQMESSKVEIPVLAKTPGLFQLVYPYQDEQFTSQRPFFFQHDNRAFFVEPQVSSPPIWWWLEHVDPGTVTKIAQKYSTTQPSLPNPIGPVSNPGDPLIFTPSYELGQPLGANLGGALVNGDLAAATILQAGQTHMATTVRSGANGAGIAQAALVTRPGSMNVSGATLDQVIIPVGLLNAVSAPNMIFLPPIQPSTKIYHFSLFYHPYVCEFVRALKRDGVDGLLQRPLQLMQQEFFENDYAPFIPQFRFWSGPVVEPYPQEKVDFCSDGSYSLYNWELFFHVPLLIASRLSQNQQFEDAQHWFHYIFDPTDTSSLPSPERFWRTKPFYLTSKAQYQQQDISAILNFLASRGNPQALSQPTSDQLKQLQDLENDVAQWRKQPFNPHLIARTRTVAYQKSVVMKYLDNLIAWGDRLFRGDTLELINEATQIYILAANILGRRPDEIPPRAIPEVQTYNSLESSLDSFSDARVRIEEFVPPSAASETQPTGQQPQVTLPSMLYFCVPKNDQLLGYWDTIADRLFKIRHCMNIEGVVQKLPLFEPPINPALLVQAAAAGIDLSSALNDINAALPYYRFTFMVQKTSELCGELKNLGSALLSALEKRDAEALAQLRSIQEVIMLNAVRLVKQQQVDEATASLTALQKSSDMVNERYKYYSTIAFINAWENTAMSLQGEALNLNIMEAYALTVAVGLYLTPDIKIGAPTSVGATEGGSNVGQSADKHGATLGTYANILNAMGSMAATLGSYQRRKDDWDLQARLAQKELAQIEQQIAAATIRQSIAVQELANHDLQIANAQAVDDVLHSKFTNQDLYDWMVGQIAGIYFQSYQLAYDLAKKVEQTYRYELGLQDSNFIQFGYWDSLKKGLLAGELLAYDLKRMELSYIDQCKREYEITRSISLAQLDPVALVQLKQGGQCFFTIPEALFDLDYPGHYLRRIKLVSVNIFCVTGPYINVNATLSLLSSSVRKSNTLLGGKYTRQTNDPRFSDSSGIVQSIATSSGQSDSGLFETNLRDERYLPFEGSGAISSWGLELPQVFQQFDYNTISDVILQIRYTARESSGLLKQQAVTELQSALNAIVLDENQKGLARLVSLRHEYPSEWYRFLHPAGATDMQSLTFALTPERFPFLSQGRHITLGKFEVFVQVDNAFAGTHNASTLNFVLAVGNSAPTPTTAHLSDILSMAVWNGVLRGEKTFSSAPGNWTLNGWLAGGAQLDPNAIEDIVVVCHYAMS